MRTLFALAAACVLVVLAGCSGSTTTSTSNTAPGDNQSVSIRDFNFNPTTVNVHKGSQVTWKNDGNVAHTATADDGSSFDSGSIAAGKSYTHTFDKTGTFPYKCSFHSQMMGTINVT